MRTLSRLFLVVPVLLASVQFAPALAQDAPAAAPPAVEKIKLALNMPLNRELDVVVKEDMKTLINMGGQESASLVAVTTQYSATVVGVPTSAAETEAKSTDLEMVYKRIHGDLDIPQAGPPGSFDSADPSLGADHPIAGSISESMAPLIDSKMTLVLSPTAEVTEVKGADEIAAEILEANPQAAMQGDPAADLREEMSNVFPQLPSDDVAVGSTWKGKRKMSIQGVKFDLDIEYTVTTVTADAVTYTAKGGGSVEGGLMNGMIPITDPSVTLEGTLSRKTGFATNEKIALRAKIDLSAMGGENGSFDVDRTLTVGEAKAKVPVTGGAATKDEGTTPPKDE